MNKIWQIRLEKSRQERQKRKKVKFLLRIVKIVFLSGLLVFIIFPHRVYRAIYPLLWGEKYDESLTISSQDFYQDVKEDDFILFRNGLRYRITPKTLYQVTGKIGYIDHYDTFWNKFYRGKSQKAYINLVPQDLIIVIGNMAKPEIFNMFKFEHEERLGIVKCKNVIYKESFASNIGLSSTKIALSQKAEQKCMPHIKIEEYNNYHPIPANNRINKALNTLIAGDVVHIEGILVDVIMPNGSVLETGLRKNQYHKMYVNGNQAGKCFILYTTKIIANGYIYQ